MGRHQFACIGLVVVGLFSSFILLAQQQPASSPAERSDGAALFASSCAGCHGSDGRGGEHAPNIATSSEVQQLNDSDLLGIVKNGLPGSGMPAFGWMGQEKVTATMLYLRKLQGRENIVELPGDPHRGELLFTGKAQCSNCHMISGKGGYIGSDLSLYGADASPEAIRTVILNPDKSLPSQKRATGVLTKSGQAFAGMLRADDNFSLSLQTTDGAFHFFQKSDLAKIDIGSHSLMPTNYGSTLSSADVDDLLSYLIRTGTERAKHSAMGGSKSDDDDE
jgi:cytochrome c oxidase cbb3-type subunit III